MCGAPSKMDTTTAYLDEEQDIERPEPDGFNSEEVGREDLVRVLAEELAPGAATSPARWRQSMASEDVTDGLVRAAQPELEQFTLDPSLAPARIVLGHG